MKYRLLSKEQFEELHQEFSIFLASQKIDKKLWDTMKDTQPKKVVSQLEKFSDIVWDKVLIKTEYLEHYSKDSINLFKCRVNNMSRIVVRVENMDVNFQDKKGIDWFINNSDNPSLKYFKGEKDYTDSRNEELFKLIEEGAILADGKLFNAVKQMIKPVEG